MEIGRFNLREMGNEQNLKCPVCACFAIFTVNFRWSENVKAFASPKNHHCPNELGRSWKYWKSDRWKSTDGMEVVCIVAGMQTTGKKIRAGMWFDDISWTHPGSLRLKADFWFLTVEFCLNAGRNQKKASILLDSRVHLLDDS